MEHKCKIFKKGNKQAGITLVALVVTMVVLLILAGVSIRLVLDNNGIITKAGDAKDKHEQGRVNDQTDLNSAVDYINQMTGENGGGSLPNGTGTTPYYPSSDFTQVSGTDLSKGLVIEDGNKNQYVWIEVPKTTTVYPTAGTAITEFTDDEYTAIETDLHTYTNDYRNSSFSDTWYDGCGVSQDEYTTMYNKMLKSIYQHGGFWIGRYEIGINENVVRGYEGEYLEYHPTTGQTPVIKANKVPYNWIRCSQAESLAETFAPSGYTSSLMFGVQWDLVLKYLETKGVSQAALKTDSTNWGNYKEISFTVTNTNAKYSTDIGASWTSVQKAGYPKPENSSVLLTTGADERNSKMNIYDIAGNLSEWTLEQSSNTLALCTFSGGNYYYNDNGSNYPASHREYCPVTYNYDTCRGAYFTLLRIDLKS